MSRVIMTHIANSFKETFPTRASEWALGTMLLIWSALMVIEPALLSNSRLRGMLLIFDQDTWAMIALIVGGGRLLILGVNGAWRRTPHLRSGAAFISCFFWFQLTISILQLDQIVTGLAFFPVLFFLDMYNVFRAARDAGYSDRIHGGARHGTDT